MNEEIDFEGLAHEIFVVAQILPNEGIEDAVVRIKEVLISKLTTESFMNSFTCPITGEQHFIGESYKEILSVDKVFNVRDNVLGNGVMYWEKGEYNGYLTIRQGLTWDTDVAIELRKRILLSIGIQKK